MSRPWLPLQLALPLAGCVGPLPHPPYSAHVTAALSAIDAPPPPGRVERIPSKPPQADAWVDGEWVLRHGRWFWLLGRWVKTPPGATYSPWVLVRTSDGTAFYAAGLWKNADGSARPAPAAISYATASGEAVFAPEGEVEDTGRNIETVPAPHPAERGP